MPGAAARDAAAPPPELPAPLSWPAEAPPDPEAGRLPQQQVDALGEAIAWLSAHLTAGTGQLLALIRRFDEAEGWHRQGFKSCAAWLGWRVGIGPGAAREKVRVAKALGELPVLREAVRTGELSYSVARAVTRVPATPENEAGLVEAASSADRYQVVVHLSAATLAGAREGEGDEERSETDIFEATDVSAEPSPHRGLNGGDPPRLQGGPRLSAETARAGPP